MDFMKLLDRELSSDDAAFIASTSNFEGNDDTRDGYTTKYTPVERDLSNDGAWKVNIQAFDDETNEQMLETSNSSHIFYHNDPYSEQLIPTSKLADRSRSIFKFNHFNRMQSKCFHTIYEQNHNCVISSPTGSGKTVLFELAILRLLNNHSNVSNVKILYIAPTKALCLEREKDWAKKFCVLGLSVGVLTSDTSFVETDKVKRSNVIITTPEKWDLMTRKWSDYTKLFEMIRVLFVDEIHILREDRGSTLEVVVTRMKKICSSMRVIALSATVPNIQDVAGWIKLNSSTPSNAVTMIFGDEFRPVELQRVIYGYKQTSNDFVFDSYLNPKILEVLSEHSNNKPVLIFCPTRSSTVYTAKYIAKNFQGLINLNNKRLKAKERDLNDIMSKGVSYHHAGLAMEDRNAVEQNFIQGSTRILCSTSTLAVGVNLPAYLVIIKGTKIWNSSQFEEYSELDVLQMMGRAGRPQFEKEGKAVLMTSDTNRQHYEKLVKGNEKLESRLHLNLPENLVSEIYLRTVTSLEDTLDWLKHTFFYSRYSANPMAYNEIPYSYESDMDARLLKYCESKIRELLDFKLIELKGMSYHSTPYGDSMTRHYVLFDTMKSFVRAHKQQGVSDILHLLSKASEFKALRLKRNEKRLFREINISPFIKSPIKLDKKRKNIEERFEKIFLIIQYELGGVEYPNDNDLIKLQQSFKQDKLFVFKHVVRLARCLADCFVTKKDFFSLRNCLNVVTYLNAGCWGDRPVVLSQIDGINRNQVRRLANQNVRNFTDLKSLDSGKVEYYLGLRPGQSKKIISQINNLPELSLSLKISKVSKPCFSKGLCITVGVDFRCKQSQKWKGRPVSVVVISGLTSGDMVDYRRSFLSTIGSRSFTFEFHLLHNDVKLTTVALCEEVSGLSETCTIDPMDFIPENFRDCLYNNPVLCEDEMETEDGLDDLLIQATSKRLEPSSKRPVSPKGTSTADKNTTCKHTCKDKTKCRHLCCREGIPPTIKKQKTASNIIVAEKLAAELQKKENKSYAVLESSIESPISKFKYQQCHRYRGDSSESEDLDVVSLLKVHRSKNPGQVSMPHRVDIIEDLTDTIFDLSVPPKDDQSLKQTETTVTSIYEDIEQANHECQIEKETQERGQIENFRTEYRDSKEDALDNSLQEELEDMFGSDVELV